MATRLMTFWQYRTAPRCILGPHTCTAQSAFCEGWTCRGRRNASAPQLSRSAVQWICASELVSFGRAFCSWHAGRDRDYIRPCICSHGVMLYGFEGSSVNSIVYLAGGHFPPTTTSNHVNGRKTPSPLPSPGHHIERLKALALTLIFYPNPTLLAGHRVRLRRDPAGHDDAALAVLEGGVRALRAAHHAALVGRAGGQARGRDSATALRQGGAASRVRCRVNSYSMPCD